jgi:hypothetical protein
MNPTFTINLAFARMFGDMGHQTTISASLVIFCQMSAKPRALGKDCACQRANISERQGKFIRMHNPAWRTAQN